MQEHQTGSFRLGDRVVHPDLNRIDGPDGRVEIEPKAMAVLVCLATRHGQVLSADQLIDEVWHGRPMGDNPVYGCINKLRKALGDSAQRPTYIATVTRKGYRLLCEPEPVVPDASSAAGFAAAGANGKEIAASSGAATRRWFAPALALVLIVAAGVFAVTRPPGAEPVPEASIAVLPFYDLEGRGEQPHDIGAGISNRVRIQLARIEGLEVAAGSAVSATRETTPQVVRDALRVAYLLEGSVRAVDGRVAYTAQLIDTKTGFEVWSDSKTLAFKSLLDIQTEVARIVVQGILVHLPIEQTLARGTNVAAAFEAYSVGRRFLALPFEPQYMDEAERWFEQARDADPDYARAWAGLCEVHRRRYRRKANPVEFETAQSLCQQALALDANLGETYLALGQLYRNRGLYEDSEANFKRAIALDPTQLDSYSGLALTYSGLHRHADAVAVFDQSVKKFPNVPVAHARYGVYLYRQGRFADAMTRFEHALDLGATDPSIYTAVGACYLNLGDMEMAIRYYERSLQQNATPKAMTNLGNAYFYLSRFEDAVEQYRAALALAATDHDLWGNLAAGLRQLPGRDEELQRVCRETVRLGREELSVNPKDAAVLSKISSCMALLGDIDGARQAARTAVDLSPDQTLVLYYSAVAFVNTGDLEEAARMIEAAMARGHLPLLVKRDPELAAALPYVQFPD